MNGNIFGVQIQPDQTQVANPFLALLLIPILEQIYHLFIKSGFNPNPLKRMLIGGLVAGLAFVASGLLEMRLQVIVMIVNYSKTRPIFTKNLSARFLINVIRTVYEIKKLIQNF